MGNLVENLKNLGTAKLMALGAVGLTFLFLIIFSFSVITKPVMSVLYSGLEPSEASSIVSVLEQSNIPVVISSDGTMVSIPKESFAAARMALASQGLPKNAGTGWEIFDSSSSLGMTSFMQQVNKLRAMEGELARSIQTINGIEAARVHLVLPEREAFSREKPTPTASVIVRTIGNYSMDKKQALAVRHLVSSAVPDLDPSKVTVLSADGEIILAEESSSVTSEVTLQSMRVSIEDRYTQAIERILSARVGAGNVRVNVNVDLNSEREVMVSESYDPEQQVVRSTETSEEIEQSAENDQSSVSVATNLPNADNGNGGATSNNSRSRTDEVVNYEIGTVKTERVKEPGEVERVSVAILVNGIYNIQDDGSVVYEERSSEEIQRINDLIRSAIGFDEARGDSISVESLRFIDYSMDVGEPFKMSLMDRISENINSIIQWVSAIIITALILLLGVRPVLNRVLPAEQAAASIVEEVVENSSDESETSDSDNKPEDKEVGGVRVVVDEAQQVEDELVDLGSVRGGVRKRRLEAMSALVSENPDETVKVLKNWIAPDLL